jgi:two-component system, cell cycle sensor histidine kinase and response regulator CckA
VTEPPGPDLGAVALSLLDGIAEGAVVLDRDWVYRYVNPAGAALLGTTAAALLGRDYREPSREVADTALQRACARVMAGGPAETVDGHHPAGGRYVRSRVLPWEGGVVVLFSDVTDERVERDRLHLDLAVLQQVVDHADAEIALRDLGGRYLLVNRELAGAARRTPEEMVGGLPHDFFAAPVADVMVAGDQEVLDSGQAHRREEVFGAVPGRARRYWTVRFPAYDAKGELSGCGSIYTDITDGRATEEQLERALTSSAETVALLETLQRSAPVGFAFVDRDFRFVRVNEAMATLNGFSVEEHLGRPVGSLVPELWPRIEPIYRRVLDTGESVTDLDLEGETAARPGERREWLVSYYPVVPHGRTEPVGIGVLAQEVTVQRRLESQLRQAQKMEAVGQLAGGIAHDFNNVLAAVTLTAEMCLQSKPEGPVHEGLSRILATAASAAGLTRQLLVFSRQQRVSPVPVDVAAAVAGVRDILGRTMGDNITLVADLRPVPAVLLDPSQLEQLVLNLAINGRDAMPLGGTLTVGARVVEVSDDDVRGPVATLQPVTGELPAGRYVEVLVSDTGTGMSAEVRDRAVEPFFTTKAGRGGTGLGLAIVYGIVRSAGGGLLIYSEPGLGTAVRVLLPAVDIDGLVAPLAAGPQRVGGTGQRVLVVEDQEQLRGVIFDLLAGAGYQVRGADAAVLMDQLDDSVPVDLLVTDVVMPDVSGPQLAHAVRTCWPGTRVLFISGYTDGMLASHGLNADDDSPLLVKPFTTAQLLQSVADALG